MCQHLLPILDTVGDTFVSKVSATFEAAGYKVSLRKLDTDASKCDAKPK